MPVPTTTYKGLTILGGSPETGAMHLQTQTKALADRIGPCNYVATADPTADDDGANTGGHGAYYAGSRWYNTTTPSEWTCISNATGAAVWLCTTLAGGAGGISNVVEDTTPQLGGNLDVNGKSIVSVSNGNILITPNGSGSIVLDGLSWPQVDGTDGYVLKTNGAGLLSWVAQPVVITAHSALTGLDGNDHPQYSLTTHNHDATYAVIGHNHDGAYSPVGHNHDGVYSLVSHDHDAAYAAIGHDHAGVYDLAGTAATAVAAHESTYAHANLHTHAQYVTLEAIPAHAAATTGHVLKKQGDGSLAWAAETSGVTDHGALSGLADNDHPQYSLTTHDHSGVYSPVGHDHDLVYAAIDHDHSGVYDPAGTGAAEVAAHELSYNHLLLHGHDQYATLEAIPDHSAASADTVLTKLVGGGLGWQAQASGVTDHGLLSGLSDNDHPQYSLTTHDHSGVYDPAGTAATAVATHESSYTHSLLHSHTNATTLAAIPDHSAVATGYIIIKQGDGSLAWGAQTGGVTDHGALTGLDDNDHPQYSLTSHDHSGVYDPAGTGAAAVASHESTYAHANLHTHAQYTTLEAIPAHAAATTGHVLKKQGDGSLAWSAETSGVTDHGALTGLDDNDHPQYSLTSHNHDAAYAAIGHDHSGVYDPAGTAASAISTHESSYTHSQLHAHTNATTLAAIPDHAAVATGYVIAKQGDGSLAWVAQSGSGVTDHGALTGLADNDHPQYSLTSHNHTGVYEPANANIQSHISSTANPHSVTATQVGRATAQWNANQLQGRSVVSTAPSTNQVLAWNGSAWAPAASGATGTDLIHEVASTTNTIIVGKIGANYNYIGSDASNCIIVGGVSNYINTGASGSSVSGSYNGLSGNQSHIVGGYYAYAAADHAMVLGVEGYSTARYGIAVGVRARAYNMGQLAKSSMTFWDWSETRGTCQRSEYSLGQITGDANLWTMGVNAYTNTNDFTQMLAWDAGTTFAGILEVVATTGTNVSACWRWHVVVEVDNTWYLYIRSLYDLHTGTAVSEDMEYTANAYDGTMLDWKLLVKGFTNQLLVQCRGRSGQTVRWHAALYTTEVMAPPSSDSSSSDSSSSDSSSDSSSSDSSSDSSSSDSGSDSSSSDSGSDSGS